MSSGRDGELDALHQQIADIAREHGERYGSARRRLVEVLFHEAQPLTVTEIAGHVDGQIPLSTVYRNVAQFEELGVIDRLVGVDSTARYELHESLSETHHHHVVCRSCGLMRDVELPTSLESAVNAEQTRVGRRNDFHIDEHRIDFFGYCSSCSDET